MPFQEINKIPSDDSEISCQGQYSGITSESATVIHTQHPALGNSFNVTMQIR